ncbi:MULTISPECIES: hypothetical protein [Agrobacterium tumefaciens complex]|uniref:Uncharacterized protein n=1 Tax=Agrobacterium tomkonis CFBP 6623 TaxID=1183432 RepID=A0A1S7SBH6_9HYPH|nr:MULTISPECIES: hypothetical protein [Agrobacterium tumefaciens complex]QCL92708.1 hypothetical protein CFBP6623_26415 [Agrobacterium tumefaciens]CUX65931.1 hypothetical protein AGR3A_pb0038 [Agrobacterium tomkonis CFBP 6623]
MNSHNEMQDRIRLMEIDIEGLRESIDLTRNMLVTMAISGKDRKKAEQLIAENREKIARLVEAIARYRDASADGQFPCGSLTGQQQSS